MDDLIIINDELDKLDGEIAQQREVVELALENREFASLNATISKEKEFLSAKYSTASPLSSAPKVTDSVCKSEAVVRSEDALKKELEADGKFRREKIKLDNLIDRRDSLKEKLSNIRATIKVFGG